MYHTAASFWQERETSRAGLLTRTERYAALTIPKVLLPDGVNVNGYDQSHDYQSIGAQGSNHITNKLMLAMFAPTKSFAKLKAGDKAKEQAAQMKLTETQLDTILANGERKAMKWLDASGQRPKLFRLLRLLVITGNALLEEDGDELRTYNLRNYAVKRDTKGKVKDIIIRECVKFDELDNKVTDLLRKRYSDDTEVYFYRWIRRQRNGAFYMTQWVNEQKLPSQFDGRWGSEATLPFCVATWDIDDNADYGTGLVEDYIGDIEALSTLSETVVDGSVQGCEVRWMVNPTGQTSVEDMNNSKNGDYVAGMPTDIAASSADVFQAVKVASETTDKYERRVSRGFLMGSAVIRDAERVTTEEVRMTAQELETAYGGVYSSLAGSLQLFVARWMFKKAEVKLGNTDIQVTIITGLDGLSRSADLENFRLAMADMAAAVNVPPELAQRMKFQEIAAFVGQGRGVDMLRFIKSDEEFAQEQQAAQAQQVTNDVTTAAGGEMAKAAAQGQA